MLHRRAIASPRSTPKPSTAPVWPVATPGPVRMLPPAFSATRPARRGKVGPDGTGIAAGPVTRGKEGHMDRISLYWKNATADAVGDVHGVTEKDLKQIAPRIKTLTKQMADERKAGRL